MDNDDMTFGLKYCVPTVGAMPDDAGWHDPMLYVHMTP